MKRLIIIFILIVCSLSFSCKKKDNYNSKGEIDLSKYEVMPIDINNVPSRDEEINLFSLSKETDGYALLKFDVSRIYYAKSTDAIDYIEMIQNAEVEINGNMYKRSDFPGDHLSLYRFIFALSTQYFKYGEIFGDYLDLPKHYFKSGAFKEVTEEEYEANKLSNDAYHCLCVLTNPVNIITNTQYNFTLVTEYNTEYLNIIRDNEKLEVKEMLVPIKKDFVGIAMNTNKAFYYWVNHLPIIKEDNKSGFLIQTTVSNYYDDELVFSKDVLQSSLLSINAEAINPDNEFPTYNLFKKYIKESNCYLSIVYIKPVTNENYITKKEYGIVYLDDLIDIVLNSTKYFNDNYTIPSQEIIDVIDSNKFRSRSVCGFVAFNTDNPYYIIDFKDNDGYYIVRNKNNSMLKSYYQISSINQIDLRKVDSVYYVRSGVITKDIINDKDYNIDVSFIVNISDSNNAKYLGRDHSYCEDLIPNFDAIIAPIDPSLLTTNNILLDINVLDHGYLEMIRNDDSFDVLTTFEINYFNNQIDTKEIIKKPESITNKDYELFNNYIVYESFEQLISLVIKHYPDSENYARLAFDTYKVPLNDFMKIILFNK